MKKGSEIKNKLAYLGALSDYIRIHFRMRKNTEIREMLYITIDSMRSEQASYNLWFEELEGVRNRSRKRLYSIADYAWDKRNVILYYTKWDREDIYFSKES